VAGSLVPAEILVVDNDPDGSAELAPDPVPGVKCLRWGRGLDLAGARNLGWRSSHSDLCFFIDDDNVVDQNALQTIAGFARDPGIGLIGPVILRGDAPDIVWCAGVRRSMVTTRTTFPGRGFKLQNITELVETDDMPDALAIPRHVLDAIEGFDDQRFPFHYDEADLAARIRKLGLRCVVAVQAHVYHYGFSGEDPGGEWLRATSLHGGRRAWLQARARVFFHRRHSHGWQRAAALALFIPLWAGAVAVACIRAPFNVKTKWIRLSCLSRGLGSVDLTEEPACGTRMPSHGSPYDSLDGRYRYSADIP